MLVACEFIEEVLLGEATPVLLLGAEIGGYGEVRHDRRVVDAVFLDFSGYFEGVLQGFGDIGEELVHLGGGFQPLLLAVKHAALVVEVFVGGQADETVVGLGVALVHEVGVVGADEFHAVTPRKLDELRLY